MKNHSKKNRFFVTGGLGYIGSAFAKEALRHGHHVLLYDSLIYEQNQNDISREILAGDGKGKKSGSLQVVIGDTRNLNLLQKSIEEFRPDFFLHLAELSSVYACDHNPSYTADINYRASKNVLALCEKLGLPVIYNSTSSLYGNQKTGRVSKESDPLPKPTDNYCKYKLLMEEWIKNRVKKNPNFQIIVFRPATVCGPAPRMRLELLPNHFTYLAVAGRPIRIADPNAVRAAIDVRDLVAGYFKAIENWRPKRLIYNIGSQNLTKRQFAEQIARIIPCQILPGADVGDRRNLQTDNSAFEKDFGFKPTRSFAETVSQTAGWLKKNIRRTEKTNFAGVINMSLEKWKSLI